MIFIVSAAPLPKIWGDDIKSMGAGRNNQVSRDKTDFHLSLFDDESVHNSYGTSHPDTPWYWGLGMAGLGLAIMWCCIKTQIYRQLDFSVCARSAPAQGGVSAQDQVTLRELEDAADECRHTRAMELEREKLQAGLELEKEKLKNAQPPPGYKEATGYPYMAPHMYPNLYGPTAPQAAAAPAVAPAAQVPMPVGRGQGNVTLLVVNSAGSKEGKVSKGLAALDTDEIWPDLTKEKVKKETTGEALAKGIKEALETINRG